MKKALIFFLFLSSNSILFAQYEYMFADKGNTRYMATGGVGVGTSYWYSKIENTELYNKYGTPLKYGDLKYKSKTAVACYDLNVVMPVSKFMLGLGINFEQNTMDKIDIRSPQKDIESIIYDQKFNLNKIYAILEVPLQKKVYHNFIANVQARFGYYSYSGVDRENFFGNAQMPNAFFVGIGAVANYRIVPHTYIFVLPSFEYKYFHNNSSEQPINITHNIYTFTLTAGIRIDVSRR